jgi:hypothetical protein
LLREEIKHKALMNSLIKNLTRSSTKSKDWSLLDEELDKKKLMRSFTKRED